MKECNGCEGWFTNDCKIIVFEGFDYCEVCIEDVEDGDLDILLMMKEEQ